MHPRSLLPRSLHPRSLLPRSLHPRSLHPRSLLPRSLNPGCLTLGFEDDHHILRSDRALQLLAVELISLREGGEREWGSGKGESGKGESGKGGLMRVCFGGWWEGVVGRCGGKRRSHTPRSHPRFPHPLQKPPHTYGCVHRSLGTGREAGLRLGSGAWDWGCVELQVGVKSAKSGREMQGNKEGGREIGGVEERERERLRRGWGGRESEEN